MGAFLLAVTTACTPDQPVTPTPTPSASVATPAETAQEREERLAYEAAETSYRQFRAEVERVYASGGATKSTALMKATAGGSYLTSYQKVSNAYHDLKHYSRGPLLIDYVRGDGFTTSELILVTCEDNRQVITYDSKGHKLYPGDVRKLRLTAKYIRGSWKIWSGTGEKVNSCE